MTLLKRLWTGDNEDPEVKTSYQYVVDLKHGPFDQFSSISLSINQCHVTNRSLSSLVKIAFS